MNKFFREDYSNYIFEANLSGSGKASSYVRALDLLSEMLKIESFGFEDCIDIWSLSSLQRIAELKDCVSLEQSKKGESAWLQGDLPKSYLLNGYCKAALSSFERFLIEKHQEDDLMLVFSQHKGSGQELAKLLDVEPKNMDALLKDIENLSSKEGKDIIRSVKTRRNQHLFRRMLTELYSGACCITGLNIPTVNRASHIVSWAKDPIKRLDPSNGLYLSATYDAAFDKHLLSLDDDYRIILSSEIRDHYTNDSVKEYFLKKEGDRIMLPRAYSPSKKYLSTHRSLGQF